MKSRARDRGGGRRWLVVDTSSAVVTSCLKRDKTSTRMLCAWRLWLLSSVAASSRS